VRVFHTSASTTQVGSALVPVFLQDEAQEGEYAGVYFHEREDIARLWGRRRGHAVYAVEAEDLELEQHPQWVGVWVSKGPVPFARLTIVSRKEGEPGVHGLLERVRLRAEELGTL